MVDDDSVFCVVCGKTIKPGTIGADEITKSVRKETDHPAGDIQEVSSAGLSDQQEWYYKDNLDKEYGPVAYYEIVEKIKKYSIDSDFMVRKENESDWIRIMSSPFREALINLSAVRVISISDRWIWCMAVIPLSALILLCYFIEPTRTLVFIWPAVSFFVSLFFYIQDRKELVLKGQKRTSWFLGIFLIPVYLVVREVRTNLNYCPAIIWCTLLFLALLII